MRELDLVASLIADIEPNCSPADKCTYDLSIIDTWSQVIKLHDGNAGVRISLSEDGARLVELYGGDDFLPILVPWQYRNFKEVLHNRYKSCHVWVGVIVNILEAQLDDTQLNMIAVYLKSFTDKEITDKLDKKIIAGTYYFGAVSFLCDFIECRNEIKLELIGEL